MGAWRPKHVEWLCRNKTCTVLHQVGVSFDLLYCSLKPNHSILMCTFPPYNGLPPLTITYHKTIYISEWYFLQTTYIRGCVDKSLARPGMKQVTGKKLEIYSKYSSRSSIHFLACCYNFYKPLKNKKFRRLSVQSGLRDSNDLRAGRIMANFQLFFLFSPRKRW